MYSPSTIRYHWALLSGPKTTGDHSYAQIMYHVKEKLQVDGSDHEPASVRSYWEYSAEHDRTPMLLIRIVVAKITNLRRLQAILRAVPILADKEDWNGVSWVQEALRLASEDNQALGTRVEDWAAIRDEAMRYVGEKKHGHRFDGLGDFDVSKPATWDMLQAKELQV